MAETTRALTVRYFASVREGIGVGSEIVELPEEVATVSDFLDWMRARGPTYDAALADSSSIRAAVDRLHATPDTEMQGAGEVAIFPMMTGG